MNLNLPELGAPEEDISLPDKYKRALAEMLAGVNGQLPENMELTRKGLVYDPGVARFLLGKDSLRIGANHRGIDANAKIGYDGAFDINAAAPVLGGRLGLDFNRANGNNRAYLKYERNF